MNWKSIQRNNFTRLENLCDFLMLDANLREQLIKFPKFALNVPYRLAAKMAKNSLDDPLLRQFIPRQEEHVISSGFIIDPVQDRRAIKEKKLLHKYHGRALLITTGACVMHCRFCFRQNFDYEKGPKSFEKELAAIANDPSLKEIILSGGDPLSLSNDVLRELIQSLDQIPHLSMLRFHTRFPLGIPERIDEELLCILGNSRLQTWMIIHCNHPSELDTDVLEALKKVQKLGIPLLNQSVLLRGVNDTFSVQKALNECLAENGIVSYYMHQLDRVQGAAHFEVTEEEGRALIQQLRASLPGYAVPRYVAEIPGRASKTVIA
jgi:EF-P beta-lysylation protein EpmB